MNQLLRAFASLALLSFAGAVRAETEGPVCATSPVSVLVEQAVINGGARIEGSIQQTKPQSITLNGSVVITGDLLVPGTPKITLNGRNNYQGTVVGPGAAAPNNFQVRLNGNVTLRHIITRTDPLPLPAVPPVPSPTGVRDVILGPSTPPPGDFASIRNLIVNGNLPPVPVPPGTYGEFIANGNNSFVLGVEGAEEAAVYNFQRLTLNGTGRLEVRGPVVLNLANNFVANGEIGSSANAGWLRINLAQGGIILNGSARLHGRALVPKGDITLNGNSTWVGSLATRKLTINGGCVIHARSTNSAPVAFSETIRTPYQTAVNIQLVGGDAEGDLLTYGLFTPPTRGVLSDFDEVAGTVTYAPDAGFHGTDTLSFVVYDEDCRSAPATISVVVEPPATPPLARSDYYSLLQDERLVVGAPGVLANDESPSGSPLAATLKTPPQSGSVTLAADGGFTYDPAPGFAGTDGFTYTLKDAGGEAVATVALRVVPRNRPPVADAQQLFTAQDSPVFVTLTGADPEGGALAFLVRSSPGHGVLTGTAPALRYIPEAGFNGADSFTFVVRDPEGLEAVGTITLTVGRTNRPPVASFTYSTPQVQPAFEVAFDARGSADTDGQVVSYAWDFDGDGVVDATGAQATHRFETGGPKTVHLLVTDDLGATGHARRPLALNLAPEVKLRGERIFTEGGPASVTVEAGDADGVVETLEIYLGEVLVGTLPRGETEFALGLLPAGFYQVNARAIDDAGAVTDSGRLHFEVRAAPGDFVVSPLERKAGLPAVLGTVGPDGEPVEGATITAHQPLLAANHYSATVDYTLTLLGNTAGTDTGYLVQDSRVDPDFRHEWNSIASSANRVDELSDADDTWEEVPLPFPFTFYGVTYESVFVSTNGVLTFGEGTTVSQPNGLPYPAVSAPLIAPFWTDLTTVNSGGDGGGYGGGTSYDRGAIYYQAFEDRVVIEYGREVDDPDSYGIRSYGDWGVYNFQVVLYRNGDVVFHYGDYHFGNDFTAVGLQKNVFEALETPIDVYWEGGDFSLRFLSQQGGAPWFTVDKLEGSLEPGQSEQLTITFHSRPDYAPGAYQGSIRVDHTQPGLDSYLVDVRLEILDQFPAVGFTSPDPARTTYLFDGDPVPLRLSASDADGWIRHLDVAVDGEPLVRLGQAPYDYLWRGAPVGTHELSAAATDNDGNLTEAEPVFVSISVDSDRDGLPDAWELDHIGDLSQDGLDDEDGDGRSNLKELFVGSSPTFDDIEGVENLPPAAHIAVARLSGEAPFEVSFDGAGSSDADGRVVAWEWDLDGDGAFDATGAQVSRVFEAAGLFPVTLQVTDDEGATASRLINVSVKAAGTALLPRPVFDAEPYVNKAALSVAFDASASSDADGEIESYRWDFGDGASGEGARVEHLYPGVGIYAVTLTVTDNDGQSATVTKHVTATHRDQSPFEETSGFLVMEGEHHTGSDQRRDTVAWAPGFEEYTGPVFGGGNTPAAASRTVLSGDRQVRLPVSPLPDIGWDHAAEVSWLVWINTPGVYYYAVRALNPAEGGTAATIHVAVDDRVTSPPGGDWVGISAWPVWRQGAPLGHLDAGLHRIQIRRGVHTIGIDQLAIALEKSALPAEGDLATLLPAQIRAGLPPEPPTALIAGDAFEARLSDTLHFDASASFSETEGIMAWTWRLHSTSPTGEPESRVLSDAPALVLPIEDLDRAYRKEHQNPGFGDYRLELSVQDELGGVATTSRALAVTDPLAAMATPDAIVVDNQDPGFSATGAWHIGDGVNDWINGVYFPGGLSEYRNQLPPGTPQLATVSIRTIGAGHFLGANFIFAEPRAAGGAELRARFTPSLAESGRYLVFARVPQLRVPAVWPDTPNPLPPVPVEIRSAEGLATLHFDQAVGGGRWRLLGVRDFAPGADAHVEFIAPAQRGFVLADAVKLVKARAAVDAPVASFVAEALPAQSVRFNASASHAPGGEVLAYFWEFGDGHLGRAASPRHRYAAPGDYTVRLTVIDSRLAVSTTEQLVTIASAPTAPERPVARLQLDRTRGRVPLTVAFDAHLSSDDEGIVNFVTRSGAIAALGSAGSLTFGEPGLHPITLTVTDDAGLTDSVTLLVEAVAAGEAEGDQVVIKADAVGGLATEGVWKTAENFFGKTLLTDDPAATLTLRPFLPHAGLYQVFLLLPENATAPDAFVAVPPTDVRLSHAGLESYVGFNATRAPLQWHSLGTFLGGNGAQDSVTIENTSGDGLFAFQAIRWVALDEGLQPAFTVALDQPIAPASASFDATASRSEVPIVRHEWDFGDGTVGQGPTVSHVYTTPGIYTVTLRVTDGRGAVGVAHRTVRVAAPNSPPQPSLVATEESPGLWRFDASASADEDGVAAHLWDFGDGQSRAGAQTRHRYVSPGNYTVTLRIVDTRDAEATATREIVVAAPPPAPPTQPFAAVPQASDALDYRFTAPEAAAHAWDFGDGATSTDAAPAHRYDAPGTYRVVLRLTTADGAVVEQVRWIAVGAVADTPPPDDSPDDPAARPILYTPLAQP